MKKLIAIISIIALIFSMSVCAFATEKEDLFYYDVESDPKLQEYIKSHKEEVIESLGSTLTNIYKYTGKFDKTDKFDESKLTFHYEKSYVLYEWTYDKAIAFMKAENKADFLEKLDLWYVMIPLSYDGDPIYKTYNIYAEYGYDAEKKQFHSAGSSMFSNRYNLTDKQEAKSILKADGFDDYEVLRTIPIDGNMFIIAQKDKETVAIYVSADKLEPNPIEPYFVINYERNKARYYETYKELFDNKIFAADDLEKLDVLRQKLIAEYEKIDPEKRLIGGTGGVSGINTDTSVEADSTASTSTVGGVDDTSVGTSVEADDKTEASGTVTTGELLAEDDGEDNAKPFPWKYVGIGAGVVVLLGVLVLVLVLVLKKKKAA